MRTSILPEIKKIFDRKTRKLFTLFSLVFLSSVGLFAQPVWVPTTPSIGTVGALSIPINYGLDRPGTVYIVILNYDNPLNYPPSTIKSEALNAPYPQKVFQAAIPVTAGNINTILQVVANVVNANTTQTVYLVAQDAFGVLQAVSIRISVTTLPCTKIDILTGFTQPVVCVNKGTVATFQTVILDPDPNHNGILKGTQWTLDWGDGNTAAYTSVADNDLPPVALRTHTYSTITSCNYVFSNGIKNPCGETRAVQYVAVVHGRDVPSDGDGILQIIDNATGLTTVNVCAGTQTTITLQDNSTWNCQNPVLPGGLTPVPNTDPRNIEWTYGEDPTGAITNTITGAVAIAGLGNAPVASGRLSPIPAPGTLSQAITIPATCLAGQYFRVWLKNWNKCNWTDPEYVDTFIDILVIAAPPAPTAANQTICFGSPNTLTVTSPPVGTITWYSDALLTTVVGTGINFNPVQTAPGIYNFWVTDQSTTGLMCMSPSTPVTLTIREALAQPGVITGPAQVCSNQAGVVFSVVANPPTMPFGGTSQYVWTVPAGWTITAGQGTKQITVTANAVAGIQTISLINQYTTIPNCPSALRSTTTNLNPVATINSANSKTVCNNTALGYTATSATPGCTFAWTRAVVAGISNGAGAGATALINESLNNTTTAPVNAIYLITPTINGCTGTTFTFTATVNPTAVITSAAAKTVCNTTALAYTSTSSTVGASFSWTRAVVAGISNGAGAGATALINESLTNTTTAPVNATYIITPAFGGCAGTPFNLVVTVNPTAVIISLATANVCNSTPLGYTATSSTVGATFAWTRAVVAGISNLAGAGATAFINESLVNTVTAPVAVTYIITPSYLGCAGTPFNLVVTVNPTSVITSAAAKTVCNTTPLAYTATSSTGGASFSWTRAVVAGISNLAGAGATALINESLTNTTTAPVNALYIITPAINGCNGTPFTLTVTVNPTAVITSAAAKTVCNTTALAYTSTSSTVGATFSWTRAVVAGISNGAGAGAVALINESLTNTTTAPVNATYIITPAIAGCAGTPFNLVVTVNPTAVITSAAAANVCNSTPLGYTATSSTVGATFAWTRAVVAGISNLAGAGATAFINESLVNTVTAPVAVTYIITPSFGGCAGTPFNLVVTVNPTSVITSAAAKTVCSNVPLAYTATSSTAGASFSWTRAVVAGISNGAGAGGTALINESLINTTAADVNAIYVITPSINGCNGTPFNLTVTVHPQFTLAQLHDNVSICNNTATNINVAMTGGTSPFTVNYTKNGVAQPAWNAYVSGTSMSTGLLIANTTYVLTSVTDNFGCPAQSLGSSILVTVGSAPTTATLTGSGDACSGATSTISSVITGGAPTYTITYTRNGVAQAPITLYNSGTNFSLGVLPVGTYNYQITSVTDLCGNIVPPAGLPGVYTININAVPSAAATINNTASICNNGTTDIVFHADVANSDFIYTVSNAPVVVWVGGKAPVAGTQVNGENVHLAQNLAHTSTFPTTVTYTITPRGPGATACLGAPITRTVVVNPTAVITSAAAQTVCNTTPLGYTATSSTVGASFSWTRAVVAGISNLAGAGATALINESLTNTTIAPVNATYIITPSIGGCAGTPFNLVVTVNPTAVITSAAAANICNNTPLGYTATSSTVGATFAWTRAVVAGISNLAGAGATSSINESLINTVTAPVAVTYIITPSFGGCAGTPFNLVVTVNPTSVITSPAAQTVCNSTPLGYTATSSTAGATFAWTRAVVAGISNGAGAGATALINESLTNTTTAPVNALYIITPGINGCNGTPFTLTVTVNPTAVITSAAAKTVCNTTALAYTATSSTAGATFAWTRAVVAGISNLAGAGATALINESLTNTTTAPVNAVYVITPSFGGCAGTPFNLTVTVNPTAVITSAAAANICNNTPLGYTATSSTAGATFAWTRAVVAGISNLAGAGATALINESLINTVTAPVAVTYIITPSFAGCAGTPFNLIVTVNPTSVITSAAAKTVCNTTPLAYTATSSTAGASFSWTRAVVAGISNGAGAGATALINESLTNTTTAAVNAVYIITPGINGCNGTPFNLTVTVNPTAVITSAAAVNICNNTPLGYTATSSTAGATFAWTRAVVAGISNLAGAGATSSINESLINTVTAPVAVTYIITPSFAGCAGTPFNLIVTVNPTSVITSAAAQTVCNTTPLSYTATSSTAGASFSWTRAVVAGISNVAGAGATALINESLTNTTTAPVNAVYVITPSINGCNGTPFNLTVTVNPTAVITSAAAVNICNNTPLGYTATSSTAGATFAWTRAVVAGISNLAGAGATALINESLINTVTAPVAVTYIITPSFGGCAGTAFNLVVTVNPTSVITSAAAKTVCNTTPLAYTATSSTAGASFSWTRAVVAGISNLAGAGATALINESLTNTTTAPVNAVYIITPSINGCNGTPFNLTVTVNPTAVITSAAAVNICNNTPLGYTATSSTAGATFAWTRAVVAGISNLAGAGATSSINESLINTVTAPVAVTYIITPSFAGCAGTPFNLVVTVNPTSVITSAAAKTVCNSTPLGYTATSSTAGASFSWTRAVVAGISNLAGAGATALINETLINTTNAPVNAIYIITPAINGCSGTPFNLTVTVNPIGEVDQPGNQVLCNGANTTAVNFTTTNAGGVTTYSWTNSVPGIGLAAAGNGNIAAFAAVNAGTAPVTATIIVTPTFTNNAVGCAGPTKTFTITVNPTPTLSTTLTPADVCSNTLFSYPPASATAGTTFNWTRAAVAGITPAGPTAGANNPNETLINITGAPIAVTYQYTLAANGCTNIQNVVVNIKPEPVITVGQNPSACSGNVLNYQILMNNFTNPADNVTFTWGVPVLNPVSPLFTGGTARAVPSAANITDIYTNTTGVLGSATYTVTPFKNGCSGAPVTVVITVGSQPVLDPGLNGFACSNTPIGLVLNVAAGSVIPTYYNIISKTVAPGLTDVGNAIVPNGTAPANYLAADKFTNTTGVNKTVTYRIQPILAPSCIGAAVDVVITIRPQPVVSLGQTKTVCSRIAIGKEILLSPLNTPAGTLFNWPVPVISDASVQGTAGVNVVADPAGTIHINDQIHNYSAAPIQAVYTITPVSQFGCAGTAVPVIITVNPEPVPQPISGRDKICVTDKNIVYNVSAVGGSTFHWTVDAAVGTKTFDFNTNAILIDAAAVAGSGNITVFETNSYTCSGDVSTLPVQVYAQPAPENITGNAIVCANSSNVYSVTNRVGSVYSWTVPGGAAIIGDPSASSITIVFANVGGTISVRETNAAGCITNHTPKAVTVNPLPTAIISGGGTICNGASRNLTVTFTGTGPYTFTYALDGVPQLPVATAANPYTLNVTAAGTYTIVNVSDANCTNNGTGTTTVSFFPKPTGTISGTAEMCKGGSTTLTMTFTGTAPYTFTYTDGVTPVNVVGYLTNVYTVSVSPLVNTSYALTSLTDGNSCAGVVSGSAVITINVPPVPTLTGTNLICNGISTGAVSMAIAGGTAPLGYSWTGPDGFTANTQNISALEAGYFAVVVTDSKGCTGSANITLTQPPVLNGSVAGTNITCFGANDGTITVSGATGGAGTYEFTINGGGAWQASPNFAGLAPGTFNVMMRDAANPTCIHVLNNALILTGPAVLNATVVKTDVNCFGANNGSIVISAPTGGYGTYGYSINAGATWQGSGNFTNLAPATYDVRIRDAVNTACFKILNPALTITQPIVLSATVSSTNITCFGLTNGTITISAPLGGHGTFEYSINGGGSWQASGNFTNLTPGTYNVQIRDAAFTGCFIVLNAGLVITQPAVLQANVASTNVTCNGANDGIISITAPLGGYGTYEYSINGGTTWQGAGLFNGLAPATYDVRIRDAANPLCFIILNAGLQITQQAVLSATLISTNVTCFGANDGVIQITNSAGGYGTYEYTDNGGTTWQATGLFTLLTPAIYNVQMRDKAHTSCVLILNAALAITQPAVLNATVNHTNVTCNSANDGTITISAPTGGYGSYGYSINGGTSWQGSGNFTNLAPGTYNIRIRDAVNTGCIIPLNPAVVITEPPVLSATIVSTAVTCNGANNGSITINGAAGGYGTYEYTINGGTTWQASPVFSALIPGFYNVKIRDAANIGCIVTLNGSLNITEPPALNANVAKTNITCNGANNGTITISSPTGGYGTYGYSINGGTTWQGSGIFTNLAPASYNVQIRDAAHTACVITLNPALIVTAPAVLAATVTPTMVTCNGANNGIISITGATGGYGTYEYTVNGGTTWVGLGNFTNLAPNTYNVQIRDAAQPACIVILNPALNITQPPVLTATVAKSNITCFGASDGSITISAPAGGYGTYEFSVNGGGSWQASGNFTLLGPGNYNVQIRDAAHPSCVIVLNNAVQITQPAVLNAVVTPANVTCKGANDGIINITIPTGGSGTYGYSIDGGTTWHAAGLFNGLVPATYDVQIRDAVNTACVITLNASLLITEPNILSATVTSSNVTCNGANDGTISITNPVGGYGTYEYSVSGGASWQASGLFAGLAPASYNVQIRDKVHTACVIILNPALVITQPPLLSATVASSNVSCFGTNNGTITITNPLGGYGTYEYSINGGAGWQGTGSFTGLPPATYNVQIRDSGHPACVVTLNAALVITQPPVLSATVGHTNVTCNGANDATITISAPAGGYGTYEYSVNGGTSWQASGNFAGQIPGFYNVQIRDAAHTTCVVILNGSLQITQPAALNAVVNSTAVTCSGANNGTITISGATGGYGTYEYSINGGAGWQASGAFAGLVPATYNVQIRDAAHTACVMILNAALVITQPAVLTATVTPVMVTCNGANDGRITISGATGGYGSYQFSINGGTTWQGSGIFTNLAPASYNVQIRDAANTTCVIILNAALSITQPSVLSATLARTNVTCFGGNDGTITISAPSGGYGTYEYSVNGGGSWQASGNFTLLTPGSYNVLIRDAANTNCTVVLNNSYTISQPAILAATVSKTDVTCKGANNGTIKITSPSGGSGTYQYSVDGGASWVASGNFINLLPATYDVRIRDAANTACSAILYPNMVITEPILLALTSTGDIPLDCFGDVDGSGTFYASGGTLPYSFHVVANTTGATLAAPGFNSQTFFNAGAGTITIAVTDFNGCFAQATINITQPALLTPGTIAANQVLCSGDNPVQLTETVPAAGGPGAYSYQWQNGSTAVGPFINIAGATGTLYTPPAGATFTLYYRRMITSGICLPVYSNVVEILVNPKPVAILTGGETICPAQTSILNVNMMVGTGPYEVNINNFGTIIGYVSGANIVVSPAVTTTYTLLSVKDANGCEVMSPSANLLGTATVTVRDLPAITTSPINKTTCEFGMVTFNVVATGTDLTYQWYVNTGSGFNPVADGGVYFGATNSTLSIFGATRLMNGYIFHVVVTGCSSTVTSTDATLTVNTDPEISAQPKDTTACMNAGAAFSIGATGTGVTYQWQVNKGAGFINVVDDANFSGSALNTLTITNAQAAFNNYIFRVVLTGTCGIPVYSNFAVLRVNIPPVITLNPVNKSACDGTGPLVFTANGSGIIDSLRWQVFSGGVWSDVFDNAVYSGSESQQLTLVTVPLPLNGNQYRLALKAKCTTVYTTGATLTVNPNPVVDFSAVDPIHACGNVPLVINGNPTGGSGIWATHLWTGDVGPLNNYYIQSPTFNSQIAGSYALNYKVKDSKGCTANGDVTVIVDAPDASFSQDKSTGCTPSTVTFTKDMTGIAKFWWDFGDGSPKDSVNANPVHTYTNINLSSIEYYNVKLTVRSPGGCLDSFTSMETVYPAIDASFTATPSTICSGGTVILTALPGANRYFWDFGDGVSGYFPNTTNHIYTNLTTSPVNDTITLTTTSFYNCIDVKKMAVKVMPVPVPQFTALPVSQIYDAAGNPVVFTNTTNAGTWTWLWKFGDGATATDQNPTHTYTALGTFDVVLVASNANCSDSVSHSVTVTPIPPVANFDLIPSGCSPLNIEINNTSLNTNTPGTTYMWDFGDGGASTAKNPTYTYFDPGTFRVQLTVTGPGGTSTFSQVVNSYPSPKANFQVSPTVVFVNDEAVRMFNLTQGADSYLWEFGDGDTSKVKEPYHKYMAEGVYDITLWAYLHNVINGQTITCSDKYVLSPGVTVEPTGVLRFSTVFTPNTTAEIELDHLPTGGTEIDQFFFPPVNQKVIKYKLQVFNRLGVLIYESNDINIPWNGYYHHKLCPQGVYVWYVQGKYANGQPFKKVGDVTLLH